MIFHNIDYANDVFGHLGLIRDLTPDVVRAFGFGSRACTGMGNHKQLLSLNRIA